MTKKSVEEKAEKLLKELEKSWERGLSYSQIDRITGKDRHEVIQALLKNKKAHWVAHWKLHFGKKT